MVLLWGHDLAGVDLSITRPSAVAILSGGIKILRVEYEELATRLSKMEVVAVDAPLTLPKGGAFRDFEREILRRGFRLLPLNMKSMRELALRGSELRKALEREGVIVLETHPTTVRRILGLSRKDLVQLMVRMGYHGERLLSPDDVDALTCLLISILYVEGKVEIVRGEEGSMVLPLPGSIP